MKLGYQTNTWGGVVGHPTGVTSVKDLYYLAYGSTEQAVREIALAGYHGIELFDGNLMQYAGNKQAFSELLKTHSLALTAVYSGANFIYRDILADELFKIEQVAQVAAELGAEHLVVGGGAIRASGIKDDDYQALAAGLEQVVEMARKLGLTPSYHPHLGTIVQAPEQLERIMALTSIYLCPDTAHIEAGGGDPLAVIRQYAERIRYVHFKDYDGSQFVPLGEGKQDFAAMVGALHDHGYEGWITTELDSHPDPLRGAQISRAYLNKL